MPSVEKAIINPFEPLSVGEALLVAASGLLVVFVMLAMLMAVIWVISKIVAALEGKKPAATPAAKKAAAPAAPVVTLTVQYMGKEMTQQAMVEAVKAQVEVEIKTLDLYAKPEEAAVYYVVNGDITGKVEF